MMLSITNRRAPATDLGYLLHKNPARLQEVDIAAGKAYVFYPCATDDCCTAVLMLDLDPVALVRELGGPKGEDAKLAQYVNDRPYVASSFLSVAMARAFTTAMKGQSRERPELVSQALPLTAELSVVRSTRGEALLRELFEPLGFIERGKKGLVQPALKCRGREYLRIIYGPEYLRPENLARLKNRALQTKRSLALREFALGVEAFERFVKHEPLYKVHECVFGVLALESEPVDPRL
jgi:hypothetical protein